VSGRIIRLSPSAVRFIPTAIAGEGVRTSQALLLRYRHDPAFDFCRVQVTYVDRGAPCDLSSVGGGEIVRLGPGFFDVVRDGRVTTVPYHRIRLIAYDGAVVWEKE